MLFIQQKADYIRMHVSKFQLKIMLHNVLLNTQKSHQWLQITSNTSTISELYYVWFCNKFIFEHSCHVTCNKFPLFCAFSDSASYLSVIQSAVMDIMRFLKFPIASKASTQFKRSRRSLPASRARVKGMNRWDSTFVFPRQHSLQAFLGLPNRLVLCFLTFKQCAVHMKCTFCL